MPNTQQSLPVQIVLALLFIAHLLCLAYSFVGIIRHVRSLSWVQVPAQLLDLYSSGETNHWADNPRDFDRLRIGQTKKLMGEYSYEYEGIPYKGHNFAFYDNRSYDLKGDTWWEEIGGIVTANDGHFLVWVNPKNPSQSVVQRDIRWFGAAVYFFWGLFGSFTFGSFLFKQTLTSLKPGQISPTFIAVLALFGIACAAVSPLLWRDRHYILSILSWTPLALALNGLRMILKKSE